jgi:hypothetical protein
MTTERAPRTIVVDASVPMLRPGAAGFQDAMAASKFLRVAAPDASDVPTTLPPAYHLKASRRAEAADAVVGGAGLPAGSAFVTTTDNGLAAAFMTAYNLHLPLRLSPDALWAAIVQAVCTYIDANAERLRADFVAHGAEDRPELTVDVPPAWEADDRLIEWEGVLEAIAAQVQARTRADVVSAFQPAFSTTDVASRTACTVCTMAAMQTFFEYSMTTLCGIGEVCMDGCEADWVALVRRAAALGGCIGAAGTDLRPWLEQLDGTLRQLLATFRGEPSVDFWRTAYSRMAPGRASGATTQLSGWFLHFFCAGPKPVTQVKLDDLPSGFCVVPFLWRQLGGRPRHFKLLAGTWSTTVDAATGAVAAAPQWAAVSVDAGTPNLDSGHGYYRAK